VPYLRLSAYIRGWLLPLKIVKPDPLI